MTSITALLPEPATSPVVRPPVAVITVVMVPPVNRMAPVPIVTPVPMAPIHGVTPIAIVMPVAMIAPVDRLNYAVCRFRGKQG